jgi:hypothetical protein
MRIMSGCSSLFALLIAAGICLGILMTPMAFNGNLSSQNGGTQSQPGYAIRSGTPLPDLFRNISRGVLIVVGGTFALGLFMCVGGPLALVGLGLLLFFYSQHQKERRHREMLLAQYAHQIAANHPPYPPAQ